MIPGPLSYRGFRETAPGPWIEHHGHTPKFQVNIVDGLKSLVGFKADGMELDTFLTMLVDCRLFVFSNMHIEKGVLMLMLPLCFLLPWMALHPSLSFTIELPVDDRIPFIGIEIIKNGTKLETQETLAYSYIFIVVLINAVRLRLFIKDNVTSRLCAIFHNRGF